MKSTPWVDVDDSYICSSFTWSKPSESSQGSLVFENEESRVQATPVSLEWYRTLRNNTGRGDGSVFDSYLCAAVGGWEETENELHDAVMEANVGSGVRVSGARILFAGKLYDYIELPKEEQRQVGFAALALSRQYRSTTNSNSDNLSRREATVETARQVEEEPEVIERGLSTLEDDDYLSENIIKTIAQLDQRMGLLSLPERKHMYNQNVENEES